MSHIRTFALTLLALPALGQSVVSTHSGVVYYFAGNVFIGDERLEQKFGRFPDIGEGRELRTERGRAEVLLTPGVMLRLGESSAVRLVSNKLSDTRVEVLRGSAILESNETTKGTAVTMLVRNWHVTVPREAVYRIDVEPAKVKVYRGEAEVATEGHPDRVRVKEGETLPLAAVLLTDKSSGMENDDFKNWAMSRSQAIDADNSVAANIIDDPSQLDSGIAVAVVGGGGITYFPSSGISSLGIASPYGLSFWSPYQSILSSIYVNPYMYMYGGMRAWPVVPVRTWPTPLRNPGYPYSYSHPIGSPRPIVGYGTRPGTGLAAPRPTYTPSPVAAPHIPPPHAPVHPGVHR